MSRSDSCSARNSATRRRASLSVAEPTSRSGGQGDFMGTLSHPGRESLAAGFVMQEVARVAKPALPGEVMTIPVLALLLGLGGVYSLSRSFTFVAFSSPPPPAGFVAALSLGLVRLQYSTQASVASSPMTSCPSLYLHCPRRGQPPFFWKSMQILVVVG